MSDLTKLRDCERCASDRAILAQLEKGDLSMKNQTVHTLKCWDVYYDAIVRGDKNFEVRRDDRGFQKGDIVVLQRCVKELVGGWTVARDYDGNAKESSFKIGWILTGGQMGIEPGFVVFSLLKESR